MKRIIFLILLTACPYLYGQELEEQETSERPEKSISHFALGYSYSPLTVNVRRLLTDISDFSASKETISCEGHSFNFGSNINAKIEYPLFIGVSYQTCFKETDIADEEHTDRHVDRFELFNSQGGFYGYIMPHFGIGFGLTHTEYVFLGKNKYQKADFGIFVDLFGGIPIEIDRTKVIPKAGITLHSNRYIDDFYRFGFDFLF